MDKIPLHQQSDPGPRSLTTWLRQVSEKPVHAVARSLNRAGISANLLTVVGFVLASAAVIPVVQGRFVVGAVIYCFAALFDGIDGAVARAGAGESRFGALLDSTLDRYSEGILLTGLGYYFAKSGQPAAVVLVFVTLLGSVMVSYVRARSEGLGLDNKVGILTRVERSVVLILALLTGWLIWGLAIMAVLTHFTVFQRVWHVYSAGRRDDR
jgi:CDP-diacylglycerol--glycerol-3-phosphate 3-phosphatidyltransferase